MGNNTPRQMGNDIRLSRTISTLRVDDICPCGADDILTWEVRTSRNRGNSLPNARG